MADDRASGEELTIACTLSAADMPDRFGEWQTFYRTSVSGFESGQGYVRLRLDATDSTLGTAASLGQREKQCCAFFSFALELEADQRWLTVRVPSGSEELLESFMGMLTRN